MKPNERRLIHKLRNMGEEDLADEVEDVLMEQRYKASLEELGAQFLGKMGFTLEAAEEQ
jgi:hypothetical protein